MMNLSLNTNNKGLTSNIPQMISNLDKDHARLSFNLNNPESLS